MRRIKRTAREAKTHRSSKDITYAIKRVLVVGAQRRQMEKLSRFIRRCPSPQPAPARRELGNPCKFYPVSPHSERY